MRVASESFPNPRELSMGISADDARKLGLHNVAAYIDGFLPKIRLTQGEIEAARASVVASKQRNDPPRSDMTFPVDPARIANLWDAEKHFAAFMRALGLDVDASEHLRDTPARVARMYVELLTPPTETDWTWTTFATDSDDLVTMRDVPFVSFCAHHFLPFTGTAHLAYIPSGKLAGLSKLARLVKHLAGKPTVQEQLTSEIASALRDNLATKSVAVCLVARHQCMEIRGVRAVGAETITASLHGDFKDDPQTRAEFYAMINGR